MTFWIACAILTTLAILGVVFPLARKATPAIDENEAAVAVYKDQLAEIDRDLNRNALQSADADAAKLEISRRILKSAAEAEATSGSSETSRSISSAWLGGIAGFVVIIALVGYLALGNPGLPGTNHALRVQQDPRTQPITEQIARVEARLRAAPEDATGWEVIAPVYMRMGRFADAARAFRRVIDLKGQSADRLRGYTQARLAMTKGVVADDIYNSLMALKAVSPQDLSAQFWLAVRKEQAGNVVAARTDYRALLRRPDLNTPMRSLLMARLAQSGATNPGATKPADGPREGGTGKLPAPDQETASDIRNLPPDERDRAIAQMVETLADRLAADGDNLTGWKNLMRAYVVLGETRKASSAYARARQAFVGREEGLSELAAFAKTLGLSD